MLINKRNRNLGLMSIIGATFLYGWFGILSKLIAYSFPIFYASAVRNFLGVVFLAIPLYLTRKSNWRTLAKSDYKWLILRAFFGLLAFISSYISFIYLEIGTAYFIFYGGSTVFGFIIGSILFKEKLSSIKIAALGLAIFGLLTIYRVNFTPEGAFYMLLAALSGCATAIWNTFSKKISDKYSALQTNFIDFVLVLLFTLICSVLRRELWVTPELSAVWLFNLLFALIFIFTGQLVVVGFKHLDAQTGSLIMLTEILFGIVLGFVFFKEVVTIFTLLGGLMVIVAILLPEIASKPNFWQKLFRR